MKRAPFLAILGLVLAACGTSPSPSPEAVPAAEFDPRLEQLVRLLEAEETRSEARAALVEAGRETIPVLLAHLEDEAVSVRWEIANLLGTILDERAIEPLAERAVRDENHHVRWRSLWALAMFRRPEEVSARLAKDLGAEDARARWNAAVGLSMFDSKVGIDVLHEGVRSPDPFRRWEAINALGRVHDERTVSVLSSALTSPSDRDRHEAVLSLGRIGGDEAIDLLLGSLDDPSASVRWRAAMVLGKLRDPRALGPLRALLESEADEEVVRRAREAVAEIESGAP